MIMISFEHLIKNNFDMFKFSVGYKQFQEFDKVLSFVVHFYLIQMFCNKYEKFIENQGNDSSDNSKISPSGGSK